MKVEIEYCGAWGYESVAREARTLILKKQPNAEVRLVKSGGGIFDIRVGGAVRYSKDEKGRFPSHEEIAATVS